jgi:hypothetical protein
MMFFLTNDHFLFTFIWNKNNLFYLKWLFKLNKIYKISLMFLNQDCYLYFNRIVSIEIGNFVGNRNDTLENDLIFKDLF